MVVTQGSATGWGTQGKENAGKQTRAMNSELSVGGSRQRKTVLNLPRGVQTGALCSCVAVPKRGTEEGKVRKSSFCLGLAWQVFGSGGVTGVAAVRTCSNLPPCPAEPIPAASKTDPLLAKAEPLSDSGSASVTITYLRMGKNCWAAAAGRGE